MVQAHNITYKVHKIIRQKNGKYFIRGIGYRAICNYEHILDIQTGSIVWKNVTCNNCKKYYK
jgi:hypothetical protein